MLPPVRPQAPPDAPVTLDGLSVPEVIARAASPALIAQEATRRYESGRYDDALLLWEAAARAGNAASLTRLAGLYDPVGFVPNRPFRDPDPRQAARHYAMPSSRVMPPRQSRARGCASGSTTARGKGTSTRR